MIWDRQGRYHHLGEVVLAGHVHGSHCTQFAETAVVAAAAAAAAADIAMAAAVVAMAVHFLHAAHLHLPVSRN